MTQVATYAVGRFTINFVIIEFNMDASEIKSFSKDKIRRR